MSSKRALRRRSCEGKIKHATLGAAIAHAKSLLHKTGRWFETYKCRFCGGFHCGRQKSRPGAKKYRTAS